MEWIEVNNQSRDKNITFPDQQSGRAALMVEQLSRDTSLDKEKKKLLDAIKKSPILPNAHQWLAQALIERRSISPREITLVEQMTKNLSYNADERFSFEKTWNSLINAKKTSPLRGLCVSTLVNTFKRAEKPFFDTTLLNNNYVHYQQLKKRYAELHTSLVQACPGTETLLNTIGIESDTLTIDEFTAFNRIKNIKQEAGKKALDKDQSGNVQFLLKNLSATLPGQEAIKLGKLGK